MATEKPTHEELIQEINGIISQYVKMISALDNQQVNQVPYENSWTVGQLFNHLTKSAKLVGQALKSEGIRISENIDERVPQLKSIFLDVTSKLKTPDRIVPDVGPYEKQQVTDDLIGSFKMLEHNSIDAKLNEVIEGLPFGPVTKYELLHFVLYHSQRHLWQMERIYKALLK